jgi:hypothetical protein
VFVGQKILKVLTPSVTRPVGPSGQIVKSVMPDPDFEEHQERMAQLRGRPVENKVFGIRIEEPEVDFATTARSFGIWSTGPVAAPGELPKVLREALKVVKGGKPAVVDVVCAMRP